jgi:hypothetical protein
MMLRLKRNTRRAILMRMRRFRQTQRFHQGAPHPPVDRFLRNPLTAPFKVGLGAALI